MTEPLSRKIERDLAALERDGVSSGGFRAALEHMLEEARLLEERQRLEGPTLFDEISAFLEGDDLERRSP